MNRRKTLQNGFAGPLLLAGVFIPVALAGAGQDAITGAGVVAVISAVWIFAFIKLLQKAGM